MTTTGHVESLVRLIAASREELGRLRQKLGAPKGDAGGAVMGASLEEELETVQRELARLREGLRDAGGTNVDFADLRRLTPISAIWGLERGKPLDRHYIETFLDRHRADIRGDVLEVKDSTYTEWFGGDRVTRAHVIDVNPANPRADVVADLTCAGAIPSDRFDCFILTQTLHVIYDVRAALSHAYRILKPGGVLLATLPAVSRVNFEEGSPDTGDYWRFTEGSVRGLFSEVFPPGTFEISTTGNILACAAFLYGLTPDDLEPHERDHVDRWFPLLFGVRAVKETRHVARSRPPGTVARRADDAANGVVLMYHRIESPREFAAQMDHIRRHYQPIGLEDLARASLDGAIPPRAVAVTFDDGYRDALDVASPVLSALDIPATFFITTGDLDEPQEYWWNALDRIFGTDNEVPQMLEVDLSHERRVFPTTAIDDRRAAHRAVKEILIKAARADRDRIVDRLVAWSGVAKTAASNRLCSADVVRLACQPGHSIGAHGVDHLFLPSQPLGVRLQQIVDSKTQLERRLGRPVRLFAYPYGGVDAHTAAMVRGAGFAAAVTTLSGLVRSGADPLQLRRYEVPSGGIGVFGEGLAALVQEA